jgi:AcrR family transcriptional regulator
MAPSDKHLQMLQAALVLFVQQGFHGTPTSQIARQAGVSNGTLFHYYKTKDDLVVALYNHIKDDLQAYLQSKLRASDSFPSRFKTTFLHSITWALDHPQEFHYIQQFHYSPHMARVPAAVLARQSKLHQDLIAEGVAAHLFKPLPVDFLFALVSSQVFGLYGYLIGQAPAEREPLLNTGFQLLWQMLEA